VGITWEYHGDIGRTSGHGDIIFFWALLGSKIGHQRMACSWEIPELLVIDMRRSSKPMGNFPAMILRWKFLLSSLRMSDVPEYFPMR
jgi:hypothetical protein